MGYISYSGSSAVERRTVDRSVDWALSPLVTVSKFGNFVHPTLPASFGMVLVLMPREVKDHTQGNGKTCNKLTISKKQKPFVRIYPR